MMKMPETLERVNEIVRRAGSPVADMTGQILRDDTVGHFLRVHVLLQNGENFTLDTTECQSLLEQAVLDNKLESLH